MDALDAKWQLGYSYLERYVAREGDARVPSSHVDEDGYPLGQWVVVQRSFHGSERLSEERASRLAALAGWVWNANVSVWEEGFSALERFVAREGHARVPVGHVDESGYRLGRWVVKQRSRFGQLDPSRIARLEAQPGWTWNTRDAAWETGFQILLQFVKREGHALGLRSHVEDGFNLGARVTKQRSAQRADPPRLLPERASRLESLPGWKWNPRENP